MFNIVHIKMSVISNIFIFTYLEHIMFRTLNMADSVTIEIMAGRCCMPIANSLWWMWLLSGRNGFCFFFNRCMKTRITSKHGIISGATAETKALFVSMSGIFPDVINFIAK